MPAVSAVVRSIRNADRVLARCRRQRYRNDNYWAAIIKVGEFVRSHPEEVWAFTCRVGKHPRNDVRAAVSTCLLEHLLEYHFGKLFDRVESEAIRSRRFASTIAGCWWFGQAKQLRNKRRLDKLLALTKRGRR